MKKYIVSDSFWALEEIRQEEEAQFHSLLLAQHFPRLKGQYFTYQLQRHNMQRCTKVIIFLNNIL